MIEIYGPKIYIAGLESLENTNLIILDETYYKKEILRKNILLKDITLTKILPDKLKMVLKMRDPYIRLMILIIKVEGNEPQLTISDKLATLLQHKNNLY